MKRLQPIVFFLLILIPGTGCDSAADDPIPEAPREVADNEYTVLPSGVKVYDFAVGSGSKPIAGQQLSVHYTGWLTDGTRFDSSRGGAPFSYIFGLGQVIPGWEEGVTDMRPGGDRQVVIPPQLGYGERGNGPVPPNATLIFEIELLSIE